ncbi:MAG: hypothetical protein ACOC0R_01680 [Mariniphaga sp.]
MKVCGFTFIRNAIRFDFPVVEAISSVLPLCDHFIVAVGNSADGTRKLIQNIHKEKVTIIDTVWDESLKKGGGIYAVETNKAFDAVPPEYDWCFYIQGDEALHEKYIPEVRHTMEEQLLRPEVEGLLFGYQHFYGTYDYIGDSRKWYRNEIRVIRNDKSIRSYRDAQGFRKGGRKLNVVSANAEIYHYGWVRPPAFMQEKIDEVRKFYQGIAKEEASQKAGAEIFDYSGSYDALARFGGTHPKVMQERIARQNWQVAVDLKRIRMKPKYRLLYFIEKKFGKRLFEYRNYKLVK